VLTITEAIAEIATIDKRLAKKKADVLPYVARQEMIRDPMEKSGGSSKYISEQRQSFSDLQARKINLRSAIAESNAETMLTVLAPGGGAMTVADWLVWRRECYAPKLDLLRGLLAQAQAARQKAGTAGLAILSSGQTGGGADVIVAVDENELVRNIDELEEVFGTLDGLLSLKNATTPIDV
jgi:hypothetical protein